MFILEEEVLEYSNLDLWSIQTPVKVDVFEKLLKEAKYEDNKTQFLVNGFRNGFDLEYNGPTNRQDTSANIPIREVGSQTELWNKVMKEVDKKRYAGPFDNPPFHSYVQSPIGLVPKAGGQTRLIFHLSYDFPKSGNKSVNYYMPKDKCAVKYNDLDDAVTESLKLLKLVEDMWNTGTIYYGKSDLKSAFRILCLKPEVFWLLIMSAFHPLTGQKYFFMDKCLPFEHSISCALFQAFSDGLAHLLRFKLVVKRIQDKALRTELTNYIDDFLFMALSRFRCNFAVTSFLQLCQTLGMPVSDEKTEWADTIIIFLGILLDGVRLVLGIPEEKKQKALQQLKVVIDSKKATIKQLQSLTGLLNFLSKALHPGRAFTRRMYAKFSSEAVTEKGLQTKKILKPYHHVRLDAEIKDDCQVWCQFLSENNSITARPFIDVNKVIQADVLDWFTDAAKGRFLGFGGVFEHRWFFGQ